MKSRIGDILFRSFSAKLNLSFSLNGNFSKSSRPHFVFIPKPLVGGKDWKTVLCLKGLDWGWRWEGDLQRRVVRGHQHLRPEWLLLHVLTQAMFEDRNRQEGKIFAKSFCFPHKGSHRCTATCISTDRHHIPRSKQIWCLLLESRRPENKINEKGKGQGWTHNPAGHVQSRSYHPTFSRGWGGWILNSRAACTT